MPLFFKAGLHDTEKWGCCSLHEIVSIMEGLYSQSKTMFSTIMCSLMSDICQTMAVFYTFANLAFYLCSDSHSLISEFR